MKQRFCPASHRDLAGVTEAIPGAVELEGMSALGNFKASAVTRDLTNCDGNDRVDLGSPAPIE
jgi:hypothetical protein